MIVKCQRCGAESEVETRAVIGEGTRKGKDIKKLSRNKITILEIFAQQRNLRFAVREIQSKLYAKGIKRWRRGDREQPSGEWNYHLVQAELSLLVGAGLITMTQDSKEYWDNKEQRDRARPIPRYCMTDSQEERFREILLQDGHISFSLIQLCPRCGSPIG